MHIAPLARKAFLMMAIAHSADPMPEYLDAITTFMSLESDDESMPA